MTTEHDAAAAQPWSGSLTLPALAEGDRYAGLILDEQGRPAHHLILLPGESDAVTWKRAVAWAKKAGGALPTRHEQALLLANCKDQFQSTWYWSGEQHAAVSAYAWCQDFVNGGQGNYRKDIKLRARAVRRSAI